jgi:hypothetical protein
MIVTSLQSVFIEISDLPLRPDKKQEIYKAMLIPTELHAQPYYGVYCAHGLVFDLQAVRDILAHSAPQNLLNLTRYNDV